MQLEGFHSFVFNRVQVLGSRTCGVIASRSWMSGSGIRGSADLCGPCPTELLLTPKSDPNVEISIGA